MSNKPKGHANVSQAPGYALLPHRTAYSVPPWPGFSPKLQNGIASAFGGHCPVP